jgi:hypothetical protein
MKTTICFGCARVGEPATRTKIVGLASPHETQERYCPACGRDNDLVDLDPEKDPLSYAQDVVRDFATAVGIGDHWTGPNFPTAQVKHDVEQAILRLYGVAP